MAMGMITAAVRIGGKPLRKAFVERTGLAGSEGFTMTDENGSFTFDGGWFDRIDVRIYCQNSVLRVLDGAKGNFPVSFSAKATNGATITIDKQRDHFRILNQCLDVYETVWRQFKPYSAKERRAFPLGKRATMRETFNSKRRIELSYPDDFPSDLAFVEPSALTNDGFPLVHIKHRSRDGRLFGEGDSEVSDNNPSLLPHELGHVFHFAALTPRRRATFEAGYLAFLLEKVAGRSDPTHEVDKTTSTLVAYIEAAAIFSERFFFFKKKIKPDLTGAALHEAFLADELSEQSTLGGDKSPLRKDSGFAQVGWRENEDSIIPLLDGFDVEGAVYGAIYLELASRIGLQEAVELVLESDAEDFAEFCQHVRGRGNADWTAAIDAVQDNWRRNTRRRRPRRPKAEEEQPFRRERPTSLRQAAAIR
jgi:hypothetical protein